MERLVQVGQLFLAKVLLFAGEKIEESSNKSLLLRCVEKVYGGSFEVFNPRYPHLLSSWDTYAHVMTDITEDSFSLWTHNRKYGNRFTRICAANAPALMLTTHEYLDDEEQSCIEYEYAVGIGFVNLRSYTTTKLTKRTVKLY